MRLFSFSLPQDARLRLGVMRGERMVDLWRHGRDVTLPFDAGDMVSLIASGEAGLRAVRRALDSAPADLPLQALRLHAPIARPRKNVFCVGWNYLEHFAEGEKLRQQKQDLPQFPVFFSKAASAVNGPRDPIPHDPAVSDRLDWEVELAVVIGEAGRNIPEAGAMRHVFGYTVINDVSARDLQKSHGGQWHKGKSLDGFCPMGPCIVTADELDPGALRVSSRVNGITKQDSSTRHMYFKIPLLIAQLSRGMTLEPGDVIATGTPEGVGFARNPPEYLHPGDVVEVEIEGIGILRNPVVAVAP